MIHTYSGIDFFVSRHTYWFTNAQRPRVPPKCAHFLNDNKYCLLTCKQDEWLTLNSKWNEMRFYKYLNWRPSFVVQISLGNGRWFSTTVLILRASIYPSSWIFLMNSSICFKRAVVHFVCRSLWNYLLNLLYTSVIFSCFEYLQNSNSCHY